MNDKHWKMHLIWISFPLSASLLIIFMVPIKKEKKIHIGVKGFRFHANSI